MARALRCPECKEWDLELTETVGQFICPCKHRREFSYELFPAFSRPDTAVESAKVVDDSDATCINHPNRTATAVCEVSGAFICELCRIDIDGRTLSLASYAREQAQGSRKHKGRENTGKSFQQTRVLWDSVALSLATIPMLLIYFTVITGPVALYLAIRYWGEHPTSIIQPRSRVRYIFAILFSSLQILGWLWLIAMLIWGR